VVEVQVEQAEEVQVEQAEEVEETIEGDDFLQAWRLAPGAAALLIAPVSGSSF